MKESARTSQVLINPNPGDIGRVNAILWGRARQYYVGEFPRPLSIKSVVSGKAMWRTSEAERVVDESNYLVLNAGRPYSITIDATQMVETFCLFFREGFIEEMLSVEANGAEALLDGPQRKDRVEFFETLHGHDAEVTPLLRRMHEALARKLATQDWLEDQFLAVARSLACVQASTAKRARRVRAKKAATREELYRRLLRGKDYMDSFYDASTSLEEIAKAACVSPYHFHRLFRAVFGETPNEYLQRKRLANAREMLTKTERTITGISLAVGFESSTSFSALFRRIYGCSPRAYRTRELATRK